MALNTGNLYHRIFDSAANGMLICDLKTGRILTANPASARMHGYTTNAFTRLRIQKLIHSSSPALFNNFIQTIQQGNTFEALTQHVRLDGALINVEWRAVPFRFHRQPSALVQLRDVSKRVQAEQEHQHRLVVRSREQSLLLEISQALNSTLEIQPQLILEQSRLLIKYTHGILFTLKDSSLSAQAIHGIEGFEKPMPIRMRGNGKDTLKVIFPELRPIRVADLWSQDPPAEFLRALLRKDFSALLNGVHAWMWIPLVVKKRIIGAVGFAHRKRNYFTPHSADLAMTIANQAAVTLVNASLFENAQALAAMQERQRLAQNLHDAVNQSLFSAGLIAEVLPRLWDRDQVEARASLEDLRRLTRGALAEMRELLAELRPSVLTDSNLGDLLRQLGNAFTGRTNIPIDLTITEEQVLPSDVQVMLYRVCQEALNNIARHAGARQVQIDVEYLSGSPQDSVPAKGPSLAEEKKVDVVEMRIQDDGHGFNSNDSTTPGHYGLAMMRERAESVGGQFSIASQPGKGTEILIRWAGTPKKESK